MTLPPLIIPFDVIVVDPDLLWRVDVMNGFSHVMVKDAVTILGACDELTPGHPAVVVLGPAAAEEQGDQIAALRSGFPEVRLLAAVDAPRPSEQLAYDRAVPGTTPVDGVVAAGVEELALARAAVDAATGAIRRRPRLVLVTAAKAGEGTTTVALNLAAAASRAQAAVVVIDADPVYGDAALMLGVPMTISGLRTDPTTGIRLLVAAGPDSPFEPLDHDALAQAVGEVRSGAASGAPADLIVVDAPADVVHRSGLAALADQVIVVCSARLSSVKNARVLIGQLRAGTIGVVVNRVGRARLPEDVLGHMVGLDILAELPIADELVPARFDLVPGVVPERSTLARALQPLAESITRRPAAPPPLAARPTPPPAPPVAMRLLDPPRPPG